MASDATTNAIIEMLRQGVSSAEIAQRLCVSPPVVWGVKSHWRLGRYGDNFGKEMTMANDVSASDDLSLISSLAEGIDPFTGEILSNENLLQHPQVVRALFHAVEALARLGKSSKRKSSLPENAGKAWSTEEDETLAREFDTNIPISELAKQHARTRGAITSRLVRLGKITVGDRVNDSPNP